MLDHRNFVSEDDSGFTKAHLLGTPLAWTMFGASLHPWQPALHGCWPCCLPCAAQGRRAAPPGWSTQLAVGTRERASVLNSAKTNYTIRDSDYKNMRFGRGNGKEVGFRCAVDTDQRPAPARHVFSLEQSGVWRVSFPAGTTSASEGNLSKV